LVKRRHLTAVTLQAWAHAEALALRFVIAVSRGDAAIADIEPGGARRCVENH
jgi:hypothetical protein